jgi:NADH-quinone oxidoreductase subunit M
MGFVFLGIASLSLVGITGAVLVMVAHGFLAALTFGLSGYLYQQTGTLEMKELGGLLRKLPFIGTALVMAAFAGCGLPGFANFAGEITVFFGAWQDPHLRLVVVLACWGALIVGAVYLLRAVRSILHADLPERWTHVKDAPHAWRKLPFSLLLAALLVFGCFPRLLSDKITPSAEKLLEMSNPALASAPSPGFIRLDAGLADATPFGPATRLRSERISNGALSASAEPAKAGIPNEVQVPLIATVESQ